MSEYAIEVNDLCINYVSMKSYSIKRNFLKGRKEKNEYFEAVRHISFKVEKGEILGLVGQNGSGKSTMLRSIAGIFSPNSGSIDLHGNSISLMSIGVGFKGELSGRENILLSGILLGFSEREIEDHMDEIIDFSELGDFIDKPVRTYSSGMHSKLAFAITAILETDIILIDEVLSVGDSRFKKKSFARIKSLIDSEERTVIIVSHINSQIRELCDKALWIDKGEFRMYGDANEVMDAYEAFMEA